MDSANISPINIQDGTVITQNQTILPISDTNPTKIPILMKKNDANDKKDVNDAKDVKDVKDVKKENTEPLKEEEVYAKLLSYQVAHVKHNVSVLQTEECCLDCSDTGTGKTYGSIAVSCITKKPIFVVCPLGVMYGWRKVAKIFRANVLGIINYESIRIGKYYNEKGEKVICPYIEVLDKGADFKWKLPDDTLLIFDEVHRCKNIKSKNSKLLVRAKGQKYKIIMLSATVADKPAFFAPFAYMLDLCSNIRIFNIYLKSLHNLNPYDSTMLALHKKIFPSKGGRLRISDLGDLFPKNQVIPESYTMGEDIEKEIQEQYQLLSVAVQDLKKKEAQAVHPLERIMRARQKIEALKVQTFVDLAEEFLENGLSVVIFVNFRDTLNLLANKLGTDCLIHGEQTSNPNGTGERERCIENFQENKSRIIIAQIQSGGVGISLHDIYGGHPRVSIISPTWSAQDLVQALGRIHRANGKTHCLQRIIFCANTVEDNICVNLQEKINNYARINDGKDESKVKLNKDIA